MSKFKRLTDAEARTLTRAKLLDRVETEQAYWSRKRAMTSADTAAEQEFRRIWHAHLSPEAAIKAAMDTVRGLGSDYWETRPCDEMPEREARQGDCPCGYGPAGNCPGSWHGCDWHNGGEAEADLEAGQCAARRPWAGPKLWALKQFPVSHQRF